MNAPREGGKKGFGQTQLEFVLEFLRGCKSAAKILVLRRNHTRFL